MGHLLKKNVSREREITNAITIEIKKRSECVHDFKFIGVKKMLSFAQFRWPDAWCRSMLDTGRAMRILDRLLTGLTGLVRV